jgi:catechol 2,3-dioxygenase-like lactoylglutathione lyase family enzyme
MRGRVTDDRPHRRHRQRSDKKQSFLLSGVGRDWNFSTEGTPRLGDWPRERCRLWSEINHHRGRESRVLASQGIPGNVPVHVAFRVGNRALVDAFYQAALAAGGRGNDAPGLRPQYHPNYYGAFALDPDGNNIEAVCRASA